MTSEVNASTLTPRFPLDGLQRVLAQLPLLVFLLVSMVVCGLKAGVGFAPLGFEQLANFPSPPDTYSALSYGLRLAVLPTRMDGPVAFSIVGLLLTLLSIVVIGVLSEKRLGRANGRTLLVLILIGPIGAVLLNRLGQNDVLVILGSCVVALAGGRIPLSLLGALIMILGNPEQATVASVCFLILSCASRFRRFRVVASCNLLIALTALLLLSQWARSVNIRNRAGYIEELLSHSFYNFFANLPLSLYAALGVTWLAFIYAFIRFGAWDRILLVTSCFAIPALMTVVTVDQTRVFIGVSTLSVTLLLVEVLPDITSRVRGTSLNNLLAWGFVTALFLPIVDIWGPGGGPRVPYIWFFETVVPQIKDLVT